MPLESFRVEAELTLDEKIAEGHHREVFRADPYVWKILMPYRVKRRAGRTVRLPLQAYIEQKHGIEDFNLHELENYRRLDPHIPDGLRGSFNPVHWAGRYQGHSVSLSDLVLNDDGSIARPLAQAGVILDEKFWSALDEMEVFLTRCKMFLIGINRENLLVQNKNGVQLPVIVDYKWMGREAFPYQFWLRYETCLKQKLHRKFQRLRATRLQV